MCNDDSEEISLLNTVEFPYNGSLQFFKAAIPDVFGNAHGSVNTGYDFKGN